MEVTRELDELLWREFVDQHPQGHIFHTPEMFQVFTRAKGHQPTLWAVVERNNRILALFLPVRVTLTDGILRRLTTRAIVYGDALHAPGIEGKNALRLLLQTYRQEVDKSILFTELRNISDSSGIQSVLIDCGFSFEDHLNYLIDLSGSPDEIWRRVSKSGRKAVNRSRRRGVVPEEVKDHSVIALY